jgi:hypothetical protein
MRGECTTHLIDPNCVATASTGNSSVAKLYRGWKDKNFEQKLAQNYGMVFEKKNNHYYVTLPGGGSSTFDLDGFDKSDKNLFDFIADSPEAAYS